MLLLKSELILLRDGPARIFSCKTRNFSTRTLSNFTPQCYAKIRRDVFLKASPLNFYVLRRFLCDDKKNFDANPEILPKEVNAFQEHLHGELESMKLKHSQTKKRAIEMYKYGHMEAPVAYINGNEIKLSLKLVILIYFKFIC